MTDPHVLASIVRASEECEIVAYEDYLESCLRAEDGVTHATLTKQARALLGAKPLLLGGYSPRPVLDRSMECVRSRA